jgi:D-3-phosphoglycerate dehydrogenase / 2-oxoglutarate reductase
MRIAIPHDYQIVVHRLCCYATLAGHEVVRYREPAAHLADFVHRVHAARAIVSVRERSRCPRALLERLPNLRVISQPQHPAHRRGCRHGIACRQNLNATCQ